MDIKFDNLSQNLNKCCISSNIIIGSLKFLGSSTPETPTFNDPRYFPFYYHLGKEFDKPIQVYQIGSKLGLIGACFIQGCDHPVKWKAMEENLEGLIHPCSIINSNLRKFTKDGGSTEMFCFYKNALTTILADQNLDAAFLTEKYDAERTQIYLEYLWNRLRPEGLLVVDYIEDDVIKESFSGFCRVKNREPFVFKTRYGVGIIVR